MSPRLFVLVAIVAGGLAWFLMKPRTHQSVVEATAALEAGVSPNPIAPSTRPDVNSAPETPASSYAPSDLGRSTDLPVYGETPSLAQISDETEKNPHETAPSLIDFSVRVGTAVDRVKNETEARRVFRDLQACVAQPRDQDAHSLQAICLVNARELATRFQTLKAHYLNLFKSANPRVQNLIKDVP